MVVLSWNQLELTRTCVRSLRAGTSSRYELIMVDNGSTDGTADFVTAEADIAVLNHTNLGFAPGMNAGLKAASGEVTVFVNNDTEFSKGWDRHLVEDFSTHPRAGVVLPAVTAAGNPVSVRSTPGDTVERLLPFGEFPSGVVYLVRTELMRQLGGWNEAFQGASAEDLDLVFAMWAHGLDVILDTRVLVEHVSQASMRERPDLSALYQRNLELFLDRWESGPDGPILDTVTPEEYGRNLERAKTAVVWIRRMIAARQEAATLPNEPEPARKKGRFRSRS